jgi:hydroxymethylbilane synthase
VETRDDGGEAFRIAKRLEHAASRIAVTAERAVLAALGGGCQAPIGSHAYIDGETLIVVGAVVSPDGAQVVRRRIHKSIADPVSVGRSLAEQLLSAGGKEILDAVYGPQA